MLDPHSWMRRQIAIVAASLMLALTALPHQATAQTVPEGAAVRAVIEDQLSAFLRDDLVAAFRHASPMVQGRFRTPTRFGMMVERGYPMIRKPRRYDMGRYSDTPAGPIQIVTFVDEAGVAWEAEYRMRNIDGDWRIAGVSLKRLPGFST
ncbi:MAG: DUF4864 domain-containing protein [Pseudomonadota bacterium]